MAKIKAPKVKLLPKVERFEGLHYDPQTDLFTLNFCSRMRPGEVQQLQWPLPVSAELIGWLVDALEKLDGDVTAGRQLQALAYRHQPKH